MAFNVKVILGIFAILCLTYNVVHSAKIAACGLDNSLTTVTSNDLELSYACTVDRIKAGFDTCSGQNCAKSEQFVQYIDEQLHPIVTHYANGCTACSRITVDVIGNILKLVVFIANQLLAILQITVFDTLHSNIIVTLITDALGLVKSLLSTVNVAVGTVTDLDSSLSNMLSVVVATIKSCVTI